MDVSTIVSVIRVVANAAGLASHRKWRRGNTGRENMDISAICNTSYGRWTYHKALREVAITHHVVCAVFPVLSAGQQHKGLDPELEQLDSV